MKKYIGHIDWFISISVIGLMFFSLAFVYSASAPQAEMIYQTQDYYFSSHAWKVAIGIVVMYVFMLVDYRFWKKISLAVIIVAVLLLLIALILGLPDKDPSRWLKLGFTRFQPSEFAKFALILHLPVLLERHKNYIKDFQVGLLPLVLWTGTICLLIVLQPSISTTIIIMLIAFMMMFIGNANILHLSGLFAVFISMIISYAFLVWKYPVGRLQAFLGTAAANDIERLTHQSSQSLIALGSGGIFGLGPGNSKQAYYFLPEPYGDFLFSIIGEEYGFLVILGIIAVFVIILWRGLKAAKRAPDLFGYYLASSIIITICLYAFVNMGVNCRLLPVTGQPLPFISYGGSAILFYCAAIGILLNISAQAGTYPRKKK